MMNDASWLDSHPNSAQCLEALGLCESHLEQYIDPRGHQHLLHQSMISPWQALEAQVRAAGFELAIASSYRSFSRQQSIIEKKWRGELVVRDSLSQILNIDDMAAVDKLMAILRWSALPGASRHHWGCDVDVYDQASLAEGYQIQLISEEFEGDGPFAAMHDFIDELMLDPAFPFFRPYAIDSGGVAPERWHLSYAPVAREYQHCLNPAIVLAALKANKVLGDDITVVASLIDEIMARFVMIDADAYPSLWR